jgi:excisionase family DNA binding protein
MEYILTIKELSEYLRLSQTTVWKYANEGKIPGFRIGRGWRFYKNKIDSLLENNSLKLSH